MAKEVLHPRGGKLGAPTTAWDPHMRRLDWARMIVKRYEGTLPPPTTLRL
jgi:hypothetical protein